MLHVHRASRAGVATFHLQSEPASLCCTESDDDGHIAQEESVPHRAMVGRLIWCWERLVVISGVGHH